MEEHRLLGEGMGVESSVFYTLLQVIPVKRYIAIIAGDTNLFMVPLSV